MEYTCEQGLYYCILRTYFRIFRPFQGMSLHAGRGNRKSADLGFTRTQTVAYTQLSWHKYPADKNCGMQSGPQVMSNDHNKAVEFIGKQYDDLDAFRKQATHVIKKITSRLDKVSRSCHEIYEAIEAIET